MNDGPTPIPGEPVRWFPFLRPHFRAHFGAPGGVLVGNFQSRNGTSFDRLERAVMTVYLALNPQSRFERDHNSDKPILIVSIPGVIRGSEAVPFVKKALDIIECALAV